MIKIDTGFEPHWKHRLRCFQRPLYSVDEMTVLLCAALGPAFFITLFTGV